MALVEHVSAERLAVLENVEAQRLATLEAAVGIINAERTEALREIRALVVAEREVVASLIGESREAVVEDATEVIDHLLRRLAQVGVFLVLLAGAALLLILGRWREVRTTDT